MSVHAAPTAVLPPAVPRTPGEAVGLLAARGATGALRGPLGSLYLADGLVTHAESDRAPDLADLLTDCGRIAPEEWRDLVRVHGPHARVGAALLAQGRLSRGELELGHLGTLFDAAFFVLADVGGGLWRFETGARHWLGPVTAVDAERLCRETGRRQRLLDGIWPWPQLDTAPVRPSEAARRPSRRPPGRRRRELLDHADGRRTPAELARLLGRSGFGVTADVRRLAAAGLLDAPAAAAPTPAPEQAREPAPEQTPTPARRTGGLHRRVPGATLTGAAAPGPTRSAHPPTPAAAHPLTVPDPDIALLTRVRTLLEARL
ncbi:transcriptional regulator [Kitasatospora aureofaciens]|uniref:transcriptional regulator n=1 Tax=Kitasatospora aureofaciens TaxID=1894 RepID=UPI0037F64B39